MPNSKNELLVADSGPLIALAGIKQLELLPKLGFLRQKFDNLFKVKLA